VAKDQSVRLCESESGSGYRRSLTVCMSGGQNSPGHPRSEGQMSRSTRVYTLLSVCPLATRLFLLRVCDG